MVVVWLSQTKLADIEGPLFFFLSDIEGPIVCLLELGDWKKKKSNNNRRVSYWQFGEEVSEGWKSVDFWKNSLFPKELIYANYIRY